jgi:hypothetical protein
MEKSPSWEANNNTGGQELYQLLWNAKAYHHAHKTPPLDSIMSQMNPVHTLTLYYLNPVAYCNPTYA